MDLPIHFSRRGFLLFGGAAASTLVSARLGLARVIKASGGLKQAKPQKALIVWYTQTLHTEYYARLIAHAWTQKGLKVNSLRLRYGISPKTEGYDLIVVGTPVHYLDAPQNVLDWLAQLNSLAGTGVAAFTTYGGPGDGQYNAALTILAGLTDKGGVPLGLDTFGNMSTYPPTWSMGNGGRVLKYRRKPDKATYAQVSAFASEVLEQYESGRGIEVKTQPSVTGLFKGGVSRSMSKVMLGKHYIDTERCIRCEICVNTCPVGAITLTPPAINTDRCLLCFGCINNCPREAQIMTVMGKPIYGFPEFLRRNGLYILPPPI